MRRFVLNAVLLGSCVVLIGLGLVGCPLAPQGEGPIANFQAVPDSGEAPLTVFFSNTSTSGDQCVVTYAWNFGDEQSSTILNPEHIYAEAGTYTVSLTITTSDGSDTATATVTVLESTAEPVTESPTWTYDTPGQAKEALEDIAVTYVPNQDGTTFTLASEDRIEELVELEPEDQLPELTDGTADYAFLDFQGDMFTFYGQKYEGLWVGGKGVIAFGEQAPDDEATHDETLGVSLLRADIDPTLGAARIAAAVMASTFIVDFEALETPAKVFDTSSFQIQGVLDSHLELTPGRCDILFEEVSANIADATIGISSAEAGSVIDANPNTLLTKSALW